MRTVDLVGRQCAQESLMIALPFRTKISRAAVTAACVHDGVRLRARLLAPARYGQPGASQRRNSTDAAKQKMTTSDEEGGSAGHMGVRDAAARVKRGSNHRGRTPWELAKILQPQPHHRRGRASRDGGGWAGLALRARFPWTGGVSRPTSCVRVFCLAGWSLWRADA